MIAKQDILDRAGEWQLRPDVVEKDYVLGWLLAALARHPVVTTTWVFKGGTCLKKCYFETYRFSEDLDFTILPQAIYDHAGLQTILVEVARMAAELSGIEFRPDLVAVRSQKDKRGRPTFQGKLGYRGPLAYPGDPRRVLLDLTQHEPVLETPLSRPVHHPYPDELPHDTAVRCYSLEELVAEKTRALVERTRPRDLYDVVYILENQPQVLDFDRVRSVFRGKCASKGLAVPPSTGIIELATGNDELRSEWSNMLAHQLPLLPPIQDLLDRLPALLRCLEEPVLPPTGALPSVPSRAADEEPVVDHGARFWGLGVPLDVARFAGSNRLLIEFDYNGRHRVAEPYSLRRPRTGNLLLYAWEVGTPRIKAFKVAEIGNLRATSRSFVPRFRVEFTEAGPLQAPES